MKQNKGIIINGGTINAEQLSVGDKNLLKQIRKNETEALKTIDKLVAEVVQNREHLEKAEKTLQLLEKLKDEIAGKKPKPDQLNRVVSKIEKYVSGIASITEKLISFKTLIGL